MNSASNQSTVLAYLLQHTATLMHRRSDQALQERLGIGMAQFKLLMILQNQEDLQQRTLADLLGQTEASISRQIKLLVEKGMLTVAINPKNRRQHLAVATSKGIKIVQAAQDTLSEYSAPAVADFSPKQAQQLQDALQIIHGHYCPHSIDGHKASGCLLSNML